MFCGRPLWARAEGSLPRPDELSRHELLRGPCDELPAAIVKELRLLWEFEHGGLSAKFEARATSRMCPV